MNPASQNPAVQQNISRAVTQAIRGVAIYRANNGGYIISASCGVTQQAQYIATSIDDALNIVREKLQEQETIFG